MARAVDLYFADRAERDRQYNARASVPDFDACALDYARLSAQAQQQCPGIYDLAYGPGRAQRLDIFPVTKPCQPAPVFVFIHGGYWRALSKNDACLMAPAMTRAGVAVCTLGYTLMPSATLFEIIAEMRSAIAWLYHNAAHYGIDPQRIVVSGSSAGAHLAGMLAAQGWPEQYGLPDNVIKGMVGLSGLYDLGPLCDTHINDWLRLNPGQARRTSPMVVLPSPGLPVALAVGGLETNGFKRQAHAYYHACAQHGVDVQHLVVPQCNHFDLVHELCNADSSLMQAVQALMHAHHTTL